MLRLQAFMPTRCRTWIISDSWKQKYCPSEQQWKYSHTLSQCLWHHHFIFNLFLLSNQKKKKAWIVIWEVCYNYLYNLLQLHTVLCLTSTISNFAQMAVNVWQLLISLLTCINWFLLSFWKKKAFAFLRQQLYIWENTAVIITFTITIRVRM